LSFRSGEVQLITPDGGCKNHGAKQVKIPVRVNLYEIGITVLGRQAQVNHAEIASTLDPFRLSA